MEGKWENAEMISNSVKATYASILAVVLSFRALDSGAFAQQSVKPVQTANKEKIDDAEAISFFLKLKQKYPDLPQIGDHSLPPHTIEVLTAGAPGNACMDLDIPRLAWDALKPDEKQKVIRFLQLQIVDAKQHPEKWAFFPPESPDYPSQMDDFRKMKANAWRIWVGHLDDQNYFVDDEVVLTGSDFSLQATKSSMETVADPASDIVFNSPGDGSVQQVKEYLAKNLNDPYSIQYQQWTDVLKTGTGYQLSVTYRAKNLYGAYVLKDQTFELNGQGDVVRVTDNGG